MKEIRRNYYGVFVGITEGLLLIALALALLVGCSMAARTLFVKVIGIDGTVIAAPLDVANVTYTQTAYVNGQPKVGDFTLTLLNSRDAKYLRGMYASLLPEQRVEIYDNRDLLGDPVFTGVIRRRAKSLTGDRLIKGDDITRRLEARKLRGYQQLTGNAATLIQSLLQTYDVAFLDDFNRATLGANWGFTGTGLDWALVSDGVGGYYLSAQYLAGQGDLQTTSTYAASLWKNSRISFDFQFTKYIDKLHRPGLVFRVDNNAGYGLGFQITQSDVDPNSAWFQTYKITGGDVLNRRDYLLAAATWYHVDITISGNGTDYAYDINGLEMLDETGYTPSNSATDFRFNVDSDTGAGAVLIDNFVFAPLHAALTPGNVATTAVTIDQQFNGDTQIAAIQWICNYLGWTYRVRPKAGAGNDLFDCGPTVGADWSGTLTLSDGEDHGAPANLESLDIDESFDGIATWLHTYGQSRDDVTSGFISTALAAMATYGIVEQDYSDPRVVSSDIAKAVGDARLAILSAGAVSLRGRIRDESYLLAQAPVWDGSAVWDGGAVWDGRATLRVGDLVPIKSPDLGLNRTATIVELTNNSGDPGIDIVFDYHGWTVAMATQRLNAQVALLQKTLDQKIDTQTFVFNLSGTTAQTISLDMRGNFYKAVYYDVTSPSWAGTVRMELFRDGVSLGYIDFTADYHSLDVTNLIHSGTYTYVVTPTQTISVTLQLRPSLMG